MTAGFDLDQDDNTRLVDFRFWHKADILIA